MALLNARLRARITMLILLVRYRLRAVRWALTMTPLPRLAGGAPDDDTDADGADGDDSSSGDDDTDDGSGDDGDDDSGDDAARRGDAATADDGAPSNLNWKQQARRHEREAKKARKEAQQLQQRLKDHEDKDKSEHEKALEEARATAREELQGAHEAERRQDRLEVMTTKVAAKGLKIGDGDDAKTVKFADPDDALVYLEREIARGDLDADDLFDDKGRVKSDVLEEALSDLLDRKPHLAANGNGNANGGRKPPAGTADAGKGKPPKSGDASPAEHLNQIRRHASGDRGGVRVARKAG